MATNWINTSFAPAIKPKEYSVILLALKHKVKGTRAYMTGAFMNDTWVCNDPNNEWIVTHWAYFDKLDE